MLFRIGLGIKIDNPGHSRNVQNLGMLLDEIGFPINSVHVVAGGDGRLVNDVRPVEADALKDLKRERNISFGFLKTDGQHDAIFDGLATALSRGRKMTVSGVSNDHAPLVLAKPSFDGLSPDKLIVDNLVFRCVTDDFVADFGKLGLLEVSQSVINFAWKRPGLGDVIIVLGRSDMLLITGRSCFVQQCGS